MARPAIEMVCLALAWVMIALAIMLGSWTPDGAFLQGLLLAALLPLTVLAVCFMRRPPTTAVIATPPPPPETSLAGELAGIGRWSVDLLTGGHRWSREFCRIAGLPLTTPPDAETLRALLPEGTRQMEVAFLAHRHDRGTYPIEFEIENQTLGTRLLRARARNVFSPEGQVEHVLMVVRDATEEYSQAARMHRATQAALQQAEEARRLANTDPLTGLPNRRSAMAALDREIVRARQNDAHLAALLFDVDFFKSINDTHGHAVGDRVLTEIAAIVRRNLREGQCAARIGGEEFLLVCPGADAGVAAEVAGRLRQAIHQGTRSADVPAVTVSVGHAALRPGETSLQLFARADEALYAAKRAGRNRVKLAA